MSIHGAIQIETNGNIVGTILSSGADCIVLSPAVIAIDASIVEDFRLLNISELGKTHYWDLVKLTIVTRPTQPTTLNKLTLTADGIDAIIISNAPSGTFTATNTTTRETVSGAINGTDSFLTTIQGSYKIRIESWPYLDFEATINAL